MKSVTRRFVVGALILCLGLMSLGMSPQQADAGLPSVPKIPKIPGVSGLSPSVISALLHNPEALHDAIDLLKWLTKNGYLVKSASFDSLTGSVTIYSKNIKTRQSRSDTIYISDSDDDQPCST